MLRTMGLARRKRTSVVSMVPLGAVSLGIVAVTASRFAWRRPKSENPADTPEVQSDQEPKREPRFKPAPPRDPDAPSWDTPPPALQPSAPSP
jgi:hypothetical protein